MKLSELPTGKAADIMLIVASCAAEITSDKEMMDTIGQAVDVKELNLNNRGVKGEFIRQWSTFIQLLLQKHRDDIFSILAAVNQVEKSDIEAQTISETMRQIEEIMQDELFGGFFASFVQSGEKKQSAPSLTVLPASP